MGRYAAMVDGHNRQRQRGEEEKERRKTWDTASSRFGYRRRRWRKERASWGTESDGIIKRSSVSKALSVIDQLVSSSTQPLKPAHTCYSISTVIPLPSSYENHSQLILALSR